MTTTVPSPPPFDPELSAVLAPIAEMMPREMSLELIPQMRSAGLMPSPSLADLRACGAVRTVDPPQAAYASSTKMNSSTPSSGGGAWASASRSR